VLYTNLLTLLYLLTDLHSTVRQNARTLDGLKHVVGFISFDDKSASLLA